MNRHFAVCVMLVAWSKSIAGELDPCDPSNHVLRKGEWRRSVNYTKESGEAAICDRYMDEGWYRFDSPAGNDIPTYCVLPNHCGTTWPIWMNGSLPTKNQEIDAIACVYNLFTIEDPCCYKTYNIKVKNCNDEFNVYYLVATDGCSQAYCVGTEVNCPLGEYSNNGFTPGCGPEPEPTTMRTATPKLPTSTTGVSSSAGPPPTHTAPPQTTIVTQHVNTSTMPSSSSLTTTTTTAPVSQKAKHDKKQIETPSTTTLSPDPLDPHSSERIVNIVVPVVVCPLIVIATIVILVMMCRKEKRVRPICMEAETTDSFVIGRQTETISPENDYVINVAYNGGVQACNIQYANDGHLEKKNQIYEPYEKEDPNENIYTKLSCSEKC
ncbi:uncharacterized protein LOC106172624 isoform X2 [Lingula anatina]|uniref:Uncharacterized protein LOC106172624 isoform X2 n=1 Tax=Lingula anatina TaxID=7574 RepID=A0A1S3JG53_LINAN|nr:uncharacterized protein LOC106172624 isoform X2 [Lingula anatina]|eukprot:XP_013408879.1 uncharacterized protein LOC106172624 isoform X2 [Lingula anatina]